MADSETQICNLALGNLGDKFITSLDENTKEARFCKAFYAPTRDGLLCVHDWSFAAARVGPLSPLVDVPAFGYLYYFQIPSDSLRVRGLYDASTVYVVEGRQILTDAETIQVLYTKKVTDPTEFPPLFTNALSYRLAYRIAYAMAPSGDLAKMLFQIYEAALLEAKQANNQEALTAETLATAGSDSWLSSRSE